ncbi:MAG TPA: P-loop NTPase fold protein [Thermoanaerobaculia bacterium]
MRMRFLPDEPIQKHEADLLGLGEFVQLIQMAVEDTTPPFVFGLLGDWGTGKTSILHLLADSFAPRFVSIRFNAWLYENEANVVYPLLHAIKKSYEENVPQRVQEENFLRSFTRVASSVAVSLADLGLRVVTKKTTGESLSLKDIAENIERVEAEEDEPIEKILGKWVDEVNNLQSAFQQLLEVYTQEYSQSRQIPASEIRFVLLIDDLDRCLPESALSLLERIKNFLAVPPCIYVFALNPRTVYRGIQIKYQGLEIDGREYLEKILSYSFYVPPPAPQKVAAFASSRLAELIAETDNKNRFEPHFATFGETLERCGFLNPRKIKRILNRFLLFLSRYEVELAKFDLSNVVRLLILAEYYPELFRFTIEGGPALADLRALNNEEFKVKAFEEKTGVSLGSIYLELRRMHALFNLTDPLPAEEKCSLAEQAKKVFSIARI